MTASGGFQSTSAADFLNWPNHVWSIGPSLAQTIFDGESRRAKVRQSQAAYDVTVADYRQTPPTAFQQVENKLAAVRMLNQVIQEQDSAIGSARRTLDEASVWYHSGIDSYLNVITAQTAVLNAREAALIVQSLVATFGLVCYFPNAAMESPCSPTRWTDICFAVPSATLPSTV